MIEAYPLYWPEGWKRTQWNRRIPHSQFKGTFAKYRDGLLRQVEMLGGKNPILSTNIPLRNDGLPYATAKEPDDAGVALYFKYKGKDMCFAADQYKYVRQNIHAIDLTIKAIRAIERYGASDMMERAFRGFTALAEQNPDTWRDVLGLDSRTPSESEIEAAFREKVKLHHPDVGGDATKFHQVVIARKNARQAIGVAS